MNSQTLINCITLNELGYTKEKAHDLTNQLTRAIHYTTVQCYINVVKNGKPITQYQNLRSVTIKEAIKLCNDKIEKAKRNKRINVNQWQELKSKLEKMG